LNLKGKVWFEKSLKKKKKKNKGTLLTFRPSRPAGPSSLSRSSPPTRPSFSFSFYHLHAGPACQLLPSPFLSSSSSPAQPDPAPPQSSPRLAAPSTFPFSLSKPIKAINFPAIN
jgi:hypothetical protein